MAAKSFSFVFFSLVVACFLQPCPGAPSFKFKKSFSAYGAKPARAERRLSPGSSSPIHYISPLAPSQTLGGFFAPAAAGSAGAQGSSTVYRLPLKLFGNGKPSAVFHGFPAKAQEVLEYLPQAMSKIIRLPLKYLSNAKPVGVYLHNPAYNFI